ncbi:MAG TPA: M42 family metallopeptidase [Candidatus Dormibacteraeota bacterium]|nr:M42 family metallopeptidase [Candidatus Dormibacteraeota bacterium]
MKPFFSCLLLLCFAATVYGQTPPQSPAQAPDRQDRVVQLLKELTEAPGPPGYEEPVRKIMTDRMRPFADKISYDGLGSIIAQQGDSGPRIMLDAHMDELGGMVRRVRPDGFISMQMLGYWLGAALPDQRWVILGSKGPILAVTDIWDAHIAPHDAQGHPQQQDLVLDTGARNAADVAALGISPGDPVAPVSDFADLANNRYLAKAWDDRVGCAVMLEVMRRLAKSPHPNQVFYVGTVQEEGSIEMRGATTSAHIINPDIGFSLEVGIPNDVPGPGPEAAQEVLGGGPGIMLYTFSELPNRKLVAHVKQVAADQHIPLQFDFVPGFGDDAGAIKLNATGVPVTTVLVPARSTHAHNGIIDRADFDRTVDLMIALIHTLDAATVARIKSFNP